MLIHMIRAVHATASIHPSLASLVGRYTGRDLQFAVARWVPGARLNGRKSDSGLMAMVHDASMILGLAAIGALALLFVRPDYSDRIKAWSPFASTFATTPSGRASVAGKISEGDAHPRAG